MSRTIVVVQSGDKFKVLVCYVQRGIEVNSAKLANAEAKRIGVNEHINNKDIKFIKED